MDTIIFTRKRFESSRSKPGQCSIARGFSFIELVVVIVILAVISAVFIARFAGANSFNGVVVRDQIIALTRIAQQSSFGRAGVTMTFTPLPGGDDATVTVAETNGTIERVTVPVSTLVLAGDVDITNSCGVTAGTNAITSSSPLVIRFGELGNIVASSGVGTSAGAVNRSVRICINNDPVMSVCVSPTGFAYARDCDVD